MKGFTIIELMVAMFVGTIVLGGTYKAFQNQRVIYKRQEVRTKLNGSLRLASDFVERYIRNAGIKGDCGSYAVEPGIAISGGNLIVTSDYNLDCTIDNDPNLASNQTTETVIFRFINNTIEYCRGSIDDKNCFLLIDNLEQNPFPNSVVSTDPHLDLTFRVKKHDPLLSEDIEEELNKRVFILNKTF